MIQEIFSLISFPGVVFHELGHEIFCRISRVRVVKVCYFQFKNPPGYVIHNEPSKYHQAFFISVGPFISGIIFSVIFFLLSKYFSNSNQLLELLFIWLGGLGSLLFSHDIIKLGIDLVIAVVLIIIPMVLTFLPSKKDEKVESKS